MNSSSQIKKFILDNLTRHQKDIIYAAVQRFGVSRQAVLKHMHALIADKQVIAHGKTRDRFYELRPQVNFNKTFEINNDFSTEELIKKSIVPNLRSLKDNIREIILFSMAAILNNCVEHSKSSKLYFKLYFTYNDLHIVVRDNGKGIFGNIKSNLSLASTQLSAIELAKGRITTDPINHSGDELYAVIKLFDNVKIESNGISLNYINYNQEWSLNHSFQQHGTRIHLKIDPSSKRSCKEIFENLFTVKYSTLCIPINLLKLPGYDLVNSRAQANNVLRNIKDFKIIEFDFNNIDLIGPAFADELIRKIKTDNQSADIQWINSNNTVDLMMSRALNRFS